MNYKNQVTRDDDEVGVVMRRVGVALRPTHAVKVIWQGTDETAPGSGVRTVVCTKGPGSLVEFAKTITLPHCCTTWLTPACWSIS
jgi:hypothetical protein